MDFDHMAIISIPSPIDLDDNCSILGKKIFFEIPVVPPRGGGGQKFFFIFRKNCLYHSIQDEVLIYSR